MHSQPQDENEYTSKETTHDAERVSLFTTSSPAPSIPPPKSGDDEIAQAPTRPHRAEHDGTVPHSTEQARTVPHDTEQDRITAAIAEERTEDHTLKVREVLKMFEEEGVTRSERCITKWCKPNRDGIAKLKAFFDENERRWFITPESVRIAIKEEQAKLRRNEPGPVPNESEPVRPGRNQRQSTERAGDRNPDSADLEELRFQVRDLEISNRAKDLHIERVEEDRTKMFDKLIDSTQAVGQLKEQLLQIGEGGHPPADHGEASQLS